jgi:hypothetical protein
MTLKVIYNHPAGKVTLELLDGVNMMYDGPIEEVDSKKLREELLYMIKVLRITNKEIKPDE